ncbi:unnamed protein product [Urochloa decumbens]|uniref:F-box domain-containing protein n=1 Tax=Urochloa decumbens TaxID=240449 RepID=A0ABC9EY98_9POAL
MESNNPRRRPRRQRRRGKPKAAPKPTTASSAPSEGATSSTVHDVPDHVLEMILLGLDSSVCLLRAASACRRWRRVVADAGFLDRFRLLRAIPGHYASRLSRNGSPVFVPSSTQQRAQSFSLDFVPKIDGSWEIADSRGTLLLLMKNNGVTRSHRFNPDLVVCEPLTRRYEAISCPPQGQCLGLFLGGGGAGHGMIGMANFKVLAVGLRKHPTAWDRAVPAVCEYSRRDGRWHSVHCLWNAHIHLPDRIWSFFFAGRANGSLYWGIIGDAHYGYDRAGLVVDEATAAASRVALPVPESIHEWHEGRCLRVIGGEGGALRVVRFIENQVKVYARFHGGNEWVLENLLLIPTIATTIRAAGARNKIVAAHETYVLVAPKESACLFLVDLKTMAVERGQDWNMYCDGDVGDLYELPAYRYQLPWPPILKAPPELSQC